MKTILYLLLFVLFLLSTTYGILNFPENTKSIGVFILTLVSLAGTILFGYLFMYYLKNE